MTTRRILTLLPFLLLPGALAQGQAPTYSGPQAVVYLPDDSDAFHQALAQAMTASKYFRVVRQSGADSLNIASNITDSGNGGNVCLPFVGCVGGSTLKANLELRDSKNGAVLRNDSCNGSSSNYSTWGYWYGGFSASTGPDQAAADCAGQLVKTLIGSKELVPYLKLAPDAPIPDSR